MSRTTSCLGIDEAGYGPTLGPLAVGFVRIDGPVGALGRAFEAARLVVSHLPPLEDSKRLHAGGRLDRLEVVALAAAHVVHSRLPTFFDVVRPVDGWQDHPWYSPPPTWPLSADPNLIMDAAFALRAALQHEGATLGACGVTLVLEGELNRAFERYSNKGTAHLEVIESTIRHAWPEDTTGRIWCDRLGGRKFYSDVLTRLFPFRNVDAISEDDATSRYTIDDGVIEVGFLVQGESRSPEVALASCLAKSVREACMHNFNRYFSQLYPPLRGTAGYPEDAVRWLAEIEGLSSHDERLRSKLVRTR